MKKPTIRRLSPYGFCRRVLADRRSWPIVAVCLLALVGWAWYKYSELGRTRAAALRALEHRDSDALYALIDPEEREKLHISANGVKATLEAALWRFGDVKPLSVSPWVQESGRSDWVVSLGRSNGSMISANGAAPNPLKPDTGMWGLMSFHQGGAGWRFNYSVFLRSLCMAQWSRAEIRARYRDLCDRNGIVGSTNENMETRLFAESAHAEADR